MPLKAIAITAYNRPQYFEKLLQSLVRNDLTGWSIHIQLEPSSKIPLFFEIAERLLKPHDYFVGVNPRQLGVALNPYSMLEKVFASGTDCCIYLEEDLLVSPDITRLANWYLQQDHENILALNLIAGGCGSTGFVSNAGEPGLLVKTKMINSLGLVLVRVQWENFFRPNWLRPPEFLIAPQGHHVAGWDWAIYDYLLHEPSLYALQPIFSRANHIGGEEATNVDPHFQRKAFEGLPIFGGSEEEIHYSVCRDPFDLPYPIRSHLNLWEEHNDAMVNLKKTNRKLRSGRLIQWDRVLEHLIKRVFRRQ